MPYKAFISYSHAADGKLAPALQGALRQFARPWNRLRALRVFRDATDLSINPNLWESVCGALSESEFFILLASPQAADSSWVRKEVDHWLSHRSLDSLLIVLTDGEPHWGPKDRTATSALPPNLMAAIKDEPLYVDMRWARTADRLSLNNPAFRDQIATIAAALRGLSKDELIGEDVTQHRKFKRFVVAVMTGLTVTTVTAITGGWIAWTQRSVAIARGVSTSALVQVPTSPELGVLLALEACKRTDASDAVEVLREVLIKARVRHEFESIIGQALIEQAQLQTQPFHDILPSPDRKLELRTGDAQSLHIMEAGTGRQITEFRQHSAEISSAAFSPDARRIISVDLDGAGYAWDTASGERIASIVVDAVQHGLRAVVWSADGSMVVTGTGDGSAQVWDAVTFRRIANLENMKGAITRLAISPDSRLIVTASTDERFHIALERDANVWDARSGKLLATLSGHLAEVEDVGFSADSRLVVTRSPDGSTRIWRADGGQPVATDDLSGLTIPAMLDRGVITLIAGEVDTSGDGALTIHNLSFSPDGSLLVTVDRDGKGKIWDVLEARLLHTLWNFTDNIRHAFAFSADGTALFARDTDNGKAWDVALGSEIKALPQRLAGEFANFMQSPAPDSSDKPHFDARLSFQESSPRIALFKERATGKVIANLDGRPNRPVAAALNADGLRIAIAEEESIEVRIYRREVGAEPADLLAMARGFVKRELSATERSQFLR